VCSVTALFRSLHQACTIQKARRAKLLTLICRGPQMSISFRCGDFIVVWKKFWNNNYLFEFKLLQHFLQLRKLSRTARKAFAGRMLCRRGLHELDRQSQPNRRGCHCRELQDQPFGTASIFSTESSAYTRSVFSCVGPSRNENQHFLYRGIMTL